MKVNAANRLNAAAPGPAEQKLQEYEQVVSRIESFCKDIRGHGLKRGDLSFIKQNLTNIKSVVEGALK